MQLVLICKIETFEWLLLYSHSLFKLLLNHYIFKLNTLNKQNQILLVNFNNKRKRSAKMKIYWFGYDVCWLVRKTWLQLGNYKTVFKYSFNNILNCLHFALKPFLNWHRKIKQLSQSYQLTIMVKRFSLTW